MPGVQFDLILFSRYRFRRLWRLALPYLDTRANRIHTRISVRLALRLIAMEGGNPNVVVPAVILHDVGWKRVPEEIQLSAFGPAASAPEVNRVHELEGVKIARHLLNEVSADGPLIGEILAIIDGHDSRRRAISRSDALVKDADKLWRFTEQGFSIDIGRFGETYEEGLSRLEDHLDGWFLTASGRKLAADLLRERQGNSACSS